MNLLVRWLKSTKVVLVSRGVRLGGRVLERFFNFSLFISSRRIHFIIESKQAIAISIDGKEGAFEPQIECRERRVAEMLSERGSVPQHNLSSTCLILLFSTL